MLILSVLSVCSLVQYALIMMAQKYIRTTSYCIHWHLILSVYEDRVADLLSHLCWLPLRKVAIN